MEENVKDIQERPANLSEVFAKKAITFRDKDTQTTIVIEKIAAYTVRGEGADRHLQVDYAHGGSYVAVGPQIDKVFEELNNIFGVSD